MGRTGHRVYEVDGIMVADPTQPITGDDSGLTPGVPLLSGVSRVLAEVDINRGFGVFAGVSPGQDVTATLQAAFDHIAANFPNGGDITFSVPGTYNINGPQQTGTYDDGAGVTYSYSGQVLIPAVSLAGTRPIRVRGPFRPNGGGSLTGAPNGVVLKSNATAGYVFDIRPGFTQFGCAWTGVMPIFEDLVVRCPDNPTCGGLNLKCTQRSQVARVAIDIPTAFTAPVAGSKEALVLPQVNCNGDITVRDSTIRGYPVGIKLGEHDVLDNVDISYCLSAFACGGNAHVNWFGYVDVEECPTIFTADGVTPPGAGGPGTAIDGSIDFQNQRTTGPLAPVAFINEAVPGSITGSLRFFCDGTLSQGIIGTPSGSAAPGRALDIQQIGPTVGFVYPGQIPTGAWRSIHPFDDFRRMMPLSGSGAPGQCNPTLHPWRQNGGGFSVSSGQLKALNTNVINHCSVPPARGGSVSRTIRMVCNLSVQDASTTRGKVVLKGHSVVSGAGVATNGIDVELLRGFALSLKANGSTIATGGSALAAGTYTVDLEILTDAFGTPLRAKVWVNGVLTIDSGQFSAAVRALWVPGVSGVEDGIAIYDTASYVTQFGIKSATPDPASTHVGTATLVAGTIAVADTNITATSKVRVFNNAAGGTPGALSVAVNAGVGFTINSTSNTDTSTVYYEVVGY